MCPFAHTLRDLIYCIVDDFFMLGLLPSLIGLGFVMFLWGVFKFVKNSEDDKARTEGKKLMLWGIFGLFDMLSVWALVGILTGVISNGEPFIPQI